MDNHSAPAPAPESSPADYPEWVNARVRAELKRRLALGKTPYALAIPKKLTAHSIRNIEDGTHSPTLTTLALLCGQLNAKVEELCFAALL